MIIHPTFHAITPNNTIDQLKHDLLLHLLSELLMPVYCLDMITCYYT